MTKSIWLEPSSEDAKYLNKIIKNLAKKHGAPKFSAHITVYSGVSSMAKAKNAVNECHASGFKVRATGIGHSEYLWKTLFVNIKKDQNLKALNLGLKKNLKAKYEFKPHISLIYKKLDTSTKRQIIQSLRFKKSFRFDKITIINSSKNVRTWKKLYTVRLKMTGNA